METSCAASSAALSAATSADALAAAVAVLETAGVSSPRADAEWLLSHVTGIPRTGLAGAHLMPQHRNEFDRLVDQRANRVPLQHLTGSTTFRYADLVVGPGVFIPRPETEVVAGWVIQQALKMKTPCVVDLCTGSGAIARSVADEVPDARVYAVELDEKAICWAEQNLAGTNVELLSGDIADAFPELTGCVDIVVANPPYIPLEAWESVHVEVRDYDPALALWSGTDGLEAIRIVESAGRRLLRPGGFAAVEHADVQAQSAPAVFTDTGQWSAVHDHRDLAGKPRFVTATRSSLPA